MEGYLATDFPLDVLAALHQFSEASHQHIFILCFEFVDMILANDFEVEEGAVLGDIPNATELFPLFFFLRSAIHDLLD